MSRCHFCPAVRCSALPGQNYGVTCTGEQLSRHHVFSRRKLFSCPGDSSKCPHQTVRNNQHEHQLLWYGWPVMSWQGLHQGTEYINVRKYCRYVSLVQRAKCIESTSMTRYKTSRNRRTAWPYCFSGYSIRKTKIHQNLSRQKDKYQIQPVHRKAPRQHEALPKFRSGP